MRFTSLFIIASTLLPIVFALPVAVPKDQSLSKCSTDVGSDVIPSLGRRFEVESDELLDRDTSELFTRTIIPKTVFNAVAKINVKNLGRNMMNSFGKTLPGASAHTSNNAAYVHRAAPVGGRNPNGLLRATEAFRKMPPILTPGATMSKSAGKGPITPINPAKITLNKKAKSDLDNLGLHGKERKKAINYHKNMIKSEIKKIPGAQTAEVYRIASVGGSDPNEPMHARVIFRKTPPGATVTKSANKKAVIRSTYTDPAGVTKNGGMHHVYPKAAALPPSYAAAERKRLNLPHNAPIPHKP